MRIAICSPNIDAYSETFIKAQIELLPATIVLKNGNLPTMLGKREIINKVKRYLNLGYREVFKRDLFSLEKALVRILKREKIDVVLAQYGVVGSEMRAVCKEAGVPLFVHFHGYDASTVQVLKDYKEDYKRMFEDAKGIIAVSKKMASQLVELGCPESKITLLHYGPHDKFFDLKPNYTSKIFFGIGRFVDKKAPYLTLLAFAEVVKNVPDAKLVIGGDGILLNTCKNIARAYGIENSISFPGILKPEETRRLMENALAFVQHSVIADSGDSEGTPVAILEASAAALPIVATKHAGIPDVVIDNETGFLVNEYDIQGMAVAMIKLVEDQELAKKMGMAGRERIRNHFTMDNYISTLRKVLEG